MKNFEIILTIQAIAIILLGIALILHILLG